MDSLHVLLLLIAIFTGITAALHRGAVMDDGPIEGSGWDGLTRTIGVFANDFLEES